MSFFDVLTCPVCNETRSIWSKASAPCSRAICHCGLNLVAIYSPQECHECFFKIACLSFIDVSSTTKRTSVEVLELD